jgi:hypothetical protein
MRGTPKALVAAVTGEAERHSISMFCLPFSRNSATGIETKARCLSSLR